MILTFFFTFLKVEHAKWFKKCAFVRQNRGQEFIELVHKRVAEKVRIIVISYILKYTVQNKIFVVLKLTDTLACVKLTIYHVILNG